MTKVSDFVAAIGSLFRALTGGGRSATSMLDTVVSDNFDGLVVIGEQGIVVASSRVAGEMLLGEGQGDLTGRAASSVLPDAILATVRHAFEAGRLSEPTPMQLAALGEADGHEPGLTVQYVVTLSAMPGARGDATKRVACLTFWDMGERQRSEARLSFLATHDPLTGALSRTGFVNAVNLKFETERGRAEGLAVMVVDLARFKPVNEALGHAHGDMLLKQVVSRLRASGIDMVARLGGHSFAVAHAGLASEDEKAGFSKLILDRVTPTYLLGAHHAIIGAAVGVSHSRVSGFDPDVLLSHADMALSVAREQPGNGWAAFSPDMDKRLRAKQDMEAALQQAIERGEISVTYQPQVALATGEMVGVEALVRWLHPELGHVPPDRFIPVAEETGRIVELGRWVLEAACIEVATWPIETRLSVNVSPVQFELVDVVAEIKSALKKSGLPPHRLDIEITEGIFMSSTRSVADALQQLRDFGVGIALDDFGTGYSSLSYLGRLPVDKIKIDQSFVRRLPADQESGAIIRAVMTLSETLGKVVIAEGIETADQAWMLRMMGCKIGQGYYYGRPQTGEEMRAGFAGKAGTMSLMRQA